MGHGRQSCVVSKVLQLENDFGPVTNQATIVLSCFSCEAEPFFGRDTFK